MYAEVNMTIYLDYIFVENLIIDYILLKQTSYISRKKITNKKAILTSVIASCYVIFMMYLKIEELNYAFCKIVLVIVMVYITFNPKQTRDYLKIAALFFLISVINVGSLMVVMNLLNMQSATAILKLIIYILSFFISISF